MNSDSGEGKCVHLQHPYLILDLWIDILIYAPLGLLCYTLLRSVWLHLFSPGSDERGI